MRLIGQFFDADRRSVAAALTACFLMAANATADEPVTNAAAKEVDQPQAQREPAAVHQPAVVGAEFIYEQAPFPQCHASTIAQAANGLVAAWFGGTREKHPDVGIWLSRH